MHLAELCDGAQRSTVVRRSAPRSGPTPGKPKEPSTSRDTVPDVEDEDDADWEKDLGSGDDDDNDEGASLGLRLRVSSPAW
jgi:hypothetical protein